MPTPFSCLHGTGGHSEAEYGDGSKIELHSQDLHCSLFHVLWVLGSWIPSLGCHRDPWHPWQVVCRPCETAQPHR